MVDARNVSIRFRLLRLANSINTPNPLRIGDEGGYSAAGARDIGRLREVESLPHPGSTELGSSVGLDPQTRCVRSIFPDDAPRYGRQTLGIGSAKSAGRQGHLEAALAFSAFSLRFDGRRVLIVPWSRVRVLAGPPSPIGIMALCPREPGTRVPWCEPLGGDPARCRQLHFADYPGRDPRAGVGASDGERTPLFAPLGNPPASAHGSGPGALCPATWGRRDVRSKLPT